MYRVLAVIVIGTSVSISLCQTQPVRRGPRLVPTNLRGINTEKNEDDPCLFTSHDGKVRRLYYISDAPGRPSLYCAEANEKGDWQPGELLQGPDSETTNISPCLTADGHDLYYATRINVRDPDKNVSARENFDVVHSIHIEKGRQFTGPTPVQSVCTEADEMHPWLTADGKQLYFTRKTSDGWRVFLAERPDSTGAFGEPSTVAEIPSGFQHPTITSDGTTMFLQGLIGDKRSGLFRSRRSRTVDRKWKPWGVPEALDPLNAPATEAPLGDMSPSLSRDDRRLYFVSDRRGGKGGRDIWVIGAANVISGSWVRAKSEGKK